MKRVNYLMQPRYRSISVDEIQFCGAWFARKDFLFFTKRPETLSPAQTKDILTNAVVLTDEKDIPVGVVKQDTSLFDSKNVILIEFRFESTKYYSNAIGERLFFGYMYQKLYRNNLYLKKVLIRVLGFDWNTKTFLENLQVSVEAILKKHIYKNGKFYDVLIYGISREEFIESNSLG